MKDAKKAARDKFFPFWRSRTEQKELMGVHHEWFPLPQADDAIVEVTHLEFAFSGKDEEEGREVHIIDWTIRG